MYEFFFSSINQETEFCIQNVEKTNRCQRLSYKLIKTNSERNLTLCKEIKDGTWSSWTDLGDCKGAQKIEGVEGARCGEGKRRGAVLPNQRLHCQGYQRRKRYCSRTLGGKFCQNDGTDYRAQFMINLTECSSEPCPG